MLMPTYTPAYNYWKNRNLPVRLRLLKLDGRKYALQFRTVNRPFLNIWHTVREYFHHIDPSTPPGHVEGCSVSGMWIPVTVIIPSTDHMHSTLAKLKDTLKTVRDIHREYISPGLGAHRKDKRKYLIHRYLSSKTDPQNLPGVIQ